MRRLVWLVALGSRRCAASCEWTFTKSDEALGAAALADLSMCNSLPARSPRGGVVGVARGDEDCGRSWFGTVFGTRMLFARLSSKTLARLPALAAWLLAAEARWRELPPNAEWPEALRAQVTSKYRSYNALAEALACDDAEVARAARALKRELAQRLVELMAAYSASRESCGAAASLRFVDDDLWGPGHARAPVGVHVQSWLNVHRAGVAGEDSLEMHAHDFPWHAYLLLDANGTNTTYHAPPFARERTRPLFNLVNSDGVLVMLSGGVDHAVPAPETFDRPRLSMAFDFAFSFDNQGTPVSHPGAEFPVGGPKTRAHTLKSDGVANSWAPFLSPDELAASVDGRAVSFDWRQTRADGRNHAGKSAWAGAVHLDHLLRRTAPTHTDDL